MSENISALEEQKIADRKIRKQDFMVIGFGIFMLVLAKILV